MPARHPEAKRPDVDVALLLAALPASVNFAAVRIVFLTGAFAARFVELPSAGIRVMRKPCTAERL